MKLSIEFSRLFLLKLVGGIVESCYQNKGTNKFRIRAICGCHRIQRSDENWNSINIATLSTSFDLKLEMAVLAYTVTIARHPNKY